MKRKPKRVAWLTLISAEIRGAAENRQRETGAGWKGGRKRATPRERKGKRCITNKNWKDTGMETV